MDEMIRNEADPELSSISGDAYVFLTSLDEELCSWSTALGGHHRLYSPLVPVKKLHQSGHFSSFPHQATFAVAVDSDKENLKSFASDPVGIDGNLNAPVLRDIEYCLTPGACYPIYLEFENQELAAPHYITVRNTCFRHETSTEKLRRQPAFNMREIVCMGTSAEIEDFLTTLRPRVEALCHALQLDIALEPATDPFFEPKRNKKFLMQKLSMLKLEMLYQGELAIGSLNDHRQGFGTTFGITRDGEPVYSACIAFGLERWLYCMFDKHGTNPQAWPAVNSEVLQ